MTHYNGQRWTAVPADYVTKAILDAKDDPKVHERFWSKVDFGDDEYEDCHIWTGALSSEGYGNFTLGRFTVRAHRIPFIWAWGSTGSKFLDHVDCLGRFCVNKHHLDTVTNAENQLKRTGQGMLIQRNLRNTILLQRMKLREERQWQTD